MNSKVDEISATHEAARVISAIHPATDHSKQASPQTASETPSIDPPPAPSQPQVYTLSFTGTGGEYFKIWIVNLLLILLTLGVYYPWAKVRKLQYLHRNMMLDGAAFDYHATGGTVLKGSLIALALYGIYHLVDTSRSWLIFAAFTVAMCVALPWLLWKSLRFKLSVTSYRALPFSFKASLKDSYHVFVPIVLYNAALLAVFFYLADTQLSDEKMPASQVKNMAIAFGFFGVLIIAFYPIFHYLLKKYQHNNYQWTSLRTSFASIITAMYKQWLLIALPLVGFYAALAFGVYMLITKADSLFNKSNGIGVVFLEMFWIVLLFAYIFTLFVPVVFKALFTSRFQNLVWNNTSAQGVKFVSQLRALL
jgi:uncharacterized membrane protein YjgN (DUF898 family)